MKVGFQISKENELPFSTDNDPGVVEANYLQTINRKQDNLLPLLVDLTNPSADTGWANSERDSLAARSKADCALALALIHHLAIGNNVPLPYMAEFCASLAECLIIDFVPKSNKKVLQLLISREDILAEFTQSGFEEAFSEKFEIIRSQQILHFDRVLFLLRRRT